MRKKKKKDCQTSAHLVYMMPDTEIFGNTEMSDIAMINFLDEQLCGFFLEFLILVLHTSFLKSCFTTCK